MRDSARLIPAVPCYEQNAPDGCAFIKIILFFFFFLNNRLYIKLKKQFRDFPGGPVVRTLPSSAVLCGCGPLHNSLSSALDYVLLPTCN